MSENSKKEILYVAPRWMVLSVAAFVALNASVTGFIVGWALAAAPDLREHLTVAQEQRDLLARHDIAMSFKLDVMKSICSCGNEDKFDGDAKIFNLDGTPKAENN